MTIFVRLLIVAAAVIALNKTVTAETTTFSGEPVSTDFFRFIEEHSGDAVKLAAQGAVPADQMEKTDEAVFFWQTNVQVGVEPTALEGEKLALNGCYRIRLADARAGVTAYFLDASTDCE
jgi:hypothetical protein